MTIILLNQLLFCNITKTVCLICKRSNSYISFWIKFSNQGPFVTWLWVLVELKNLKLYTLIALFPSKIMFKRIKLEISDKIRQLSKFKTLIHKQFSSSSNKIYWICSFMYFFYSVKILTYSNKNWRNGTKYISSCE